jgi:Immunity protein 49
MNELQIRLIELSNSIKSNEYSHLQRVINHPIDERLNIMSFWGDNQFLAINEWFVNLDLTKTKQHFYKCGRMFEYETKKFDAPIMSFGMYYFDYLMLSDNPNLINRFADFTYESTPANRSHKEGIERGYYNSFIYLLQCSIKNDWVEFDRILPIVQTKANKRYKMPLEIAFIEALRVEDKEKIEWALHGLTKPKMQKKNNNMPILDELICHPVIGYAKLAWYKGIEVEVDSPLVPREWLPIQPLKDDEYIDYDFVKAYLG